MIVGFFAAAAGPVGGVMSLVSFPALLAMGYEPMTANVTNTVAVVTVGTISSSVAYRSHIDVKSGLAVVLLAAAGLGGLAGGVLLMLLGDRFFEDVVPLLLLSGAALIVLQPFVVRRLGLSGQHHDRRSRVVVGTALVSVYTGYFGAGAGVLLFGLFATMLPGGVQSANALKSLVSIAGNITAALYFTLAGAVAWELAVPLAIGSLIGGQIGVRVARRMPDVLLRIVIAVGGVTAALVAVR